MKNKTILFRRNYYINNYIIYSINLFTKEISKLWTQNWMFIYKRRYNGKWKIKYGKIL